MYYSAKALEDFMESNTPKQAMRVSFDYRWLIVAALGVVIVVMLVLWRPWEPQIDRNARTIDVTGQAVLKAEPDQIVFMPQYSFDNTDKDAAVTAAAEKRSTLLSKLKSLGVKSKDIKADTSGYNGGFLPENDDAYTYTLSLVVTLEDMKLAQKVQDYLATTSPEGQVTPQYGFKKATQTSLEAKARARASKDAKNKAEQSAENLGFSVARVKSVSDSNLGGYPYMLDTRMVAGAEDSVASSSEFPLQPGENELNYSVSVTFYIN